MDSKNYTALPIISTEKAAATTTGLQLDSSITFDEWRALGKNIKMADRAVQWWIGDWLNFGEAKYGEMYAQAMDEHDLAYQTLQDYKYVASKVQLSVRTDNLTFMHHKMVAALPPPQQTEWLDKAEDEGWSAKELRKQIKHKDIVRKIEELEDRAEEDFAGEFDVIVIDPPWPMEKIDRDARPNQAYFDYPVMEEEEIADMELPMADSCHIWLWTTQKFLPMAMRCLDAWGVKYVCTFVWHKPGGFQPIGLPQYNCEFALYARRGTPIFADTKAFNTAFTAQRGEHSEKPEAFYDVVRRVTAGRRADVFNRRNIDGFVGWGNESGE